MDQNNRPEGIYGIGRVQSFVQYIFMLHWVVMLGIDDANMMAFTLSLAYTFNIHSTSSILPNLC